MSEKKFSTVFPYMGRMFLVWVDENTLDPRKYRKYRVNILEYSLKGESLWHARVLTCIEIYGNDIAKANRKAMMIHNKLLDGDYDRLITSFLVP